MRQTTHSAISAEGISICAQGDEESVMTTSTGRVVVKLFMWSAFNVIAVRLPVVGVPAWVEAQAAMIASEAMKRSDFFMVLNLFSDYFAAFTAEVDIVVRPVDEISMLSAVPLNSI